MCAHKAGARWRGMVLAVLGLWLGTLGGASAQDIRGSISGRVTDASGGILIGVTVTVQNTATGVPNEVVTNESGLFNVLFLPPGDYRVTVKLDGFRSAVREHVNLRVEDRVTLDVALEPAGATESVEVMAAPPLLETRTATSGQVFDSKTIAEMPLGDGTAYFLARLAPGVEFTADPKFTRPMDNVNLAGVSASGVVRTRASGENNDNASTEFMIDGVPNHVSQNRLGFSPPASAVQEFKVSTSLFDAQFGAGAGGAVSLGLKSGTNQFRGEASYFNRDESRSANTFFANRVNQPVEARDYHRTTMMLGGPIHRNRTFFMIAGEYLYDDAPEPLITTVPTERQRNGDFSEYPAVQIYDPFSSRREPDGLGGTRVVRTPFAGNVIPQDRIHPIAQKVLSYYPLPNLPRELWNANGTNNYFSDRNRPYDYRGMVSKVDHTLNSGNRLFVNVSRNWRMEDRNNWTRQPITESLDWRSNTAVLVGWTSMLSSSTVLDLRVNRHQFGEWQLATEMLSAADFGFNEHYQSLIGDYPYFPRFDMETYQDIGSQRPGGRYTFSRPHTRYAALPTVTTVRGRHTMKAGYDFRLIRESEADTGFRGGEFTFRGGSTNQGTGASGANTHRDLAGLLLGAPTDGQFQIRSPRQNQNMYHGVFIQDDWRVSQRLTLNLGLRWEMETGITESQDRNVRGFDLTTPNPIEAAARARLAADFAANPAAFEVSPGRYFITPDSFHAIGGYTFAGDGQSDFWRVPKNNFLPRIGAAYQVTQKLVLRGGYGLFTLPYTISGVDQRGFARNTDIEVNDLDNLPRRGIYEDPLAGGSLLEPVGSARGLLTDVGNAIGGQDNTVVPYDREMQRFTRFQVGFQYELPLATVLELNYVGSRGSNLIVQDPMNFIPAEFLIDSVVNNNAAESFLSGLVPNPFRGLPDMVGTALDANTISRESLLRQFPQFTTFRIQSHDGSNRYDSVQLRLERRFSKGIMVMGNYTYARLLEKTTRLNASDPDLTERVSENERPHSYKIATVIEMPFGRGQRWGAEWPGWLDAALGGWRLSANYLWQMGAPIEWNNMYYDPTRNPHDLKTRYGKDEQGRRYGIDIPAWDISGFYFHDAAVSRINPATGQLEIDPARQLADGRISHFNDGRYKRSFPQTIDGLRRPNYHNLDVGLAKTFNLGRTRLQIRAEAFNMENYADFSYPDTAFDPRSGNFGRFTGQRNLPRDVQIGARLTF